MSKLIKLSEEFLENNLTRNIYKDDGKYLLSHCRALSTDGDKGDWGKGKNDNNDDSVGNLKDRERRYKLKAKNDYSFTDPYVAGEDSEK